MSKDSIDILLIDNLDSFTYNIVHLFRQIGREVAVFGNDRITARQCLSLKPRLIVIGPGPGGPSGAGVSLELIALAEGKTPILGICLGHQCVVSYFGGRIVPSSFGPRHGKITGIRHDGRGMFAGLPQGFKAAQYNSLVAEKRGLPSCLKITAENSDGDIMAVSHKTLPVFGIQFHPESVLSEYGERIFSSFTWKTPLPNKAFSPPRY